MGDKEALAPVKGGCKHGGGKRALGMGKGLVQDTSRSLDAPTASVLLRRGPKEQKDKMGQTSSRHHPRATCVALP